MLSVKLFAKLVEQAALVALVALVEPLERVERTVMVQLVIPGQA
jgi:hypothetical protein